MLQFIKQHLVKLGVVGGVLALSIGTLFAMNGSDSFTIPSGEGVVLSFPKKVDSISFSKTTGFTIRTLEGGQWIDMTDQVSDYYPLRGYLIRNSGAGDLVIDVDYAMLSSVEETLFQKDLPAGWNLVGVAYKDDHFGRVSSADALGESLPYSQVIDFTGKNFPFSLISDEATPMNQIDDNNINILTKSELSTKNLFERLAYGIFVNIDAALSGTQEVEELTDNTTNNTYDTGSSGTGFITSLEAANELAGLGIIVDHSSNSIDYKLTFSISREELAKIITILGNVTVVDANSVYEDTDFGSGFEKYAHTLNLVGYEPSNQFFYPKNNTSKYEALNWIMHARDIASGAGSSAQEQRVAGAVAEGIAISFNDYETDVSRGQVFIWAAEALRLDNNDDFLSDLISPATENVLCSSDPVFANNSCDICSRTYETDLSAGFNLNPANIEFINDTGVDQLVYKEEQINPQMISLHGSSWSNIHTDNFWGYTESFNDLYTVVEGAYVVSAGNDIIWLDDLESNTYRLDTLDESNENVGLLKSTILTHDYIDGNVTANGVNRTQCVLYRNNANQEPATADVSLVPLADTSVIKGAADVTALQFEVEAGEQRVRIDNMYLSLADTSADGFASTQEITGIKLYQDDPINEPYLVPAIGDLNISSTGAIVIDAGFTDYIEANTTHIYSVLLSFADTQDTIDYSDYTLSLIDLNINTENDLTVDETGLPATSSRNITVTDSGKLVTLAFDSANADNENDKLALAGESVVIASYDVRADNEPLEADRVYFTISGASGLQNSVINATLLLDGVPVATNTNSGITDTTISFEPETNLIIPETTSELALQLNTANIGENEVGQEQTNIQITNVVIAAIGGIESGIALDSGDVATQTGGSSQTLDIVSALVTPSVVSMFGFGDNTAELRLLVDGGSNTASNGDAVSAELQNITLEVSSLTSGGSVIVFNGDNNVVGSGSISAPGIHTINLFTPDLINGDDETYRIQSNAQANHRLATDGVTYSTNGIGSTSTKLENTLDLGSYEEVN